MDIQSSSGVQCEQTGCVMSMNKECGTHYLSGVNSGNLAPLAQDTVQFNCFRLGKKPNCYDNDIINELLKDYKNCSRDDYETQEDYEKAKAAKLDAYNRQVQISIERQKQIDENRQDINDRKTNNGIKIIDETGKTISTVLPVIPGL